jgi:shikimate kinase
LNNLIIIGFKSAGKTTMGQSVALKLGKQFIDVDDLFKEPPAHLYRRVGAESFREQEKMHLQSLSSLSGGVIATGGGVVCDADNCHFLRKLGLVVHLHTPKEIIKERIFSSQLPIFLEGPHPEARFERLYYNRLGIYTAIAHHCIITEDELWEVIRLDPFSA